VKITDIVSVKCWSITSHVWWFILYSCIMSHASNICIISLEKFFLVLGLEI